MILIFDEMSGITSEDQATLLEITNAILDVFKNNNFNVYTNIFTCYKHKKANSINFKFLLPLKNNIS